MLYDTLKAAKCFRNICNLVVFVCHFAIYFFSHANICQQVQDIEFMQIEMKVVEGLKVGNDCLKSMHEVDMFFLPAFCV